MTKQQFLDRIKIGISSLPQGDIEKYLQYYSEMIDDRMEEGMTEEEAVADVGTVNETVAQILRDRPASPQLNQQNKKSFWEKLKDSINDDTRPWIIAALVITFPIWGSVTVGIASAVASVIIGAFSAIIGLYAASFGVFAGFVGCVVKSVAIFSTGGVFSEGIMYLGAGLLCCGIAILIFLLAHLFMHLAVKLIKYGFGFLKTKIGKGEVKQ